VRFLFGDVIVDDDARGVQRSQRPVHVSPKAFDLLVALIRERPRVVSKADLHARLWPDTFVSDASLAMLVAEVRAAIGDDARKPRWVRTSHRRGYAFQPETPGEVVAVQGSDGRRPTAGETTGLWIDAAPRRFPLLPGENLVGRDPECPVWLDSPSVSRRHARVVVSGRGATIEDLGSKNGTQVAGRAVKGPMALTDGDTLRFGSIGVVFRAWSADHTLTEGGS
jgi:DNA-binding winged helix-turn-helix (wHTH) protein